MIDVVQQICGFRNNYYIKIVQILGGGMSTKIWEVAVEHAKTTCIKSDKVHIYYPDSPSKTAVVFNVVGEVRGLISEKFVSVDDFTEKEKVFTLLLSYKFLTTNSYVLPFYGCDLDHLFLQHLFLLG
jgi:hypothetical protein